MIGRPATYHSTETFVSSISGWAGRTGLGNSVSTFDNRGMAVRVLMKILPWVEPID
jgi:hypothetical protein